ncbi:hypothetical protein [Arsenophonus sp.]|uniref:hypothetical protein n=1 Tax=Arsenophonus sp. TaxID=1872640 RepID=UPI00285917A9|nr:hypothetical protein [Arsenophonus sp.]MDR5615232.1 hypothetical protein [Arsenophonus sp.]
MDNERIAADFWDDLENVLLNVEYVNSIIELLLKRQELKKHEEIVLLALFDLTNNTQNTLNKMFYKNDCIKI